MLLELPSQEANLGEGNIAIFIFKAGASKSEADFLQDLNRLQHSRKLDKRHWHCDARLADPC